MTEHPEPKAINSLVEFSEAFQFSCHTSPQLPPEAVAELRMALMREELREIGDELALGNLVGVLDGLCDLQYVLSGTVLACGFTANFAEAFAEVHRSNMSKACKTMEEAEATVKYHSDGGTPCFIQPVGELFLVRRSADNKLLKSINYSPADLEKFIV